MKPSNQFSELSIWTTLDLIINQAKDGARQQLAQASQSGKIEEAQQSLDNWNEIEEFQKSVSTMKNKLGEFINPDDMEDIASAVGKLKTPTLTTRKVIEEETKAPVVQLTIAERKVKFKKDFDTVLDRSDELFDKEEWDQHTLALVKSHTCEVRAVLAEGDSLGEDTTDLKQEVLDLKDRFDQETNGVPFYGFSLRRIQTAETWRELADAYQAIAVSSDVLDWLETEPEIDEDIEQDLIVGASASETWLYRVFGEYQMKVGDDQQRNFNTRVRNLVAGRFYVPWWNMDPDQKVETRNIRAAAKSLQQQFDQIKNGGSSTEALTLDDVVSSDSYVSDFLQQLTDAVLEELNEGAKPNSKALREKVAPYFNYLKDNDNEKYEKLVGYLNKDYNSFVDSSSAQKIEMDAGDDLVDEVKELVSGKTMLMVGDNEERFKNWDKVAKSLDFDKVEWMPVDKAEKSVDKFDFVGFVYPWGEKEVAIGADSYAEVAQNMVTFTSFGQQSSILKAMVNQLAGNNSAKKQLV